jgi:DNA-binding NtrC family response regulator
MVVDDDPDTLYLFKEILINGYNVIGFLDSILAFGYIKVHHKEYTIVLTDYRMPSMSGCQFVKKRIQELDNRIRIIIITALHSVNKSLKVPIIFKPITMRELVDLIKDNIIF